MCQSTERNFEASLFDVNVLELADTIAQVHDCSTLHVYLKY